MLTLRDYQQAAVHDAVSFLALAQPSDRRLYVAPCGTGKSVIEVAVQHAIAGSVIVTPRIEIIEGMVEKGADRERCFTPITFRNRLLSGSCPPPPALIIDEAHHDTADTADTIRLCVGQAPTVAYTATPYRGTPQGTAALRSLYGEPRWILTLRDAVSRGLCAFPECRTVPILDDDEVTITNGEFKVRAVEAKTPWTAAADLVSEVWQTPRPTIVSLPSVQAVRTLAESLRGRVPTVQVTGESSPAHRSCAFAACVACDSVLLQIQVVSEGVDLPIRRLIDLAPTMSPVRWLQQVGRIMRPTDTPPEYICANRNLLRHGYLLDGLVPIDALRQGQVAFTKQGSRHHIRAFGLEGVGRLKPARLPLANGLFAHAYYVTRTENHRATQYTAIVLPHSPAVLWARRLNVSTPRDGESTQVEYGRWERCEPPSELRGFGSVPPRPLSPRQLNWWKGAALRHGLDADADVDAKAFAALPVLVDTDMRIN